MRTRMVERYLDFSINTKLMVLKVTNGHLELGTRIGIDAGHSFTPKGERLEKLLF